MCTLQHVSFEPNMNGAVVELPLGRNQARYARRGVARTQKHSKGGVARTSEGHVTCRKGDCIWLSGAMRVRLILSAIPLPCGL